MGRTTNRGMSIPLLIPPPRYTSNRCVYCGEGINPRSRACPSHTDLLALDTRYVLPKGGES